MVEDTVVACWRKTFLGFLNAARVWRTRSWRLMGMCTCCSDVNTFWTLVKQHLMEA
jgi:hypothetical protein